MCSKEGIRLDHKWKKQNQSKKQKLTEKKNQKVNHMRFTLTDLLFP